MASGIDSSSAVVVFVTRRATSPRCRGSARRATTTTASSSSTTRCGEFDYEIARIHNTVSLAGGGGRAASLPRAPAPPPAEATVPIRRSMGIAEASMGINSADVAAPPPPQMQKHPTLNRMQPEVDVEGAKRAAGKRALERTRTATGAGATARQADEKQKEASPASAPASSADAGGKRTVRQASFGRERKASFLRFEVRRAKPKAAADGPEVEGRILSPVPATAPGWAGLLVDA